MQERASAHSKSLNRLCDTLNQKHLQYRSQHSHNDKTPLSEQSAENEDNAKENAEPVPSEKTRQHVVPAPSTSTAGPKQQTHPRSHSEVEEKVTDNLQENESTID
ncbi:hypothetical protein B9Z55_026708 [Caenorhabditis nigoni]|uniref:Uncharacterized protein n=1 Tax=Caenorhabditis nigoni TaxID=1611254 RepID=A0A2G5T4F5_9PELO|nr:hypothetical protein B9Z55_026708 [Caenorhabditis nigoni]